MQSYNDIPSSGQFSAIVDALNRNFQLTKQKLEELEHMCLEGFCGHWPDELSLVSAYPNPEAGRWAYVGASLPWAIYTVSNGSWTDSSETYSGSVELAGKASQADLDALRNAFYSLTESNYVFVGVISPNSVPSQTSGVQQFYIAWTAGTYTRFGGYTLSDGEIAVITYDGGWDIYKTPIIAQGIVGGYDDVPTLNSRKPVESGGVYQALQALTESMNSAIADINTTFLSGEHVDEVSLTRSFGSNANALPTQGAVLNEIDVSALDGVNTAAYRLGGKALRYTVVKTQQGNTYKVGMLELFSDSSGHVLTQVLTTHYVLDGQQISDGVHSDDKVFQYYRSCKISGGTLPSGTGVWTSWKRVNSDAWVSDIATALLSYYMKSEVYSKSETYSKNEVDVLVGSIKSLEYVVADSLPTASAATMYKVYLVPSAHSSSENVKDEYITTLVDGVYDWEQIGSTAVDLSGYSTTSEMNAAISSALSSYLTSSQVNTLLESYYTKSEVNTALGGKQDAIGDLSDIRAGAAAGATALQPEDIQSMKDEVPIEGSDNLMESGGVAREFLHSKGAVSLREYSGWLDSSNRIISSANGYYRVLPVDGGETLYFDRKKNRDCYLMVLSSYDYSHTLPYSPTFVSAEGVFSGRITITSEATATITIPSEARFILIGSKNNAYGTDVFPSDIRLVDDAGSVSLLFDVRRALDEVYPSSAAGFGTMTAFRGKKLSIIGDSISTFNKDGCKIDGYRMYYPHGNVDDVSQTWWMQLLNLCEMELLVNAAWSGSCVTNLRSSETYEGQNFPDFYDRTSLLSDLSDPENPVNPDVIIVALGTNDSRSTVNAPIGTLEYDKAIAELSEANFCEAYIKGIKALMVNYPSADIYCLSFYMNDVYRAAIKDIASHFGLHYIDCGDYNQDTMDTMHPSSDGMDYIANKVSNHFVIEKSVKHDDTLDYISKLSGSFTPALELGGINSSGNEQTRTDRLRTSYIPVSKATFARTGILHDYVLLAAFYDSDKHFISILGSYGLTIDSSVYPNGTSFIRYILSRNGSSSYHGASSSSEDIPYSEDSETHEITILANPGLEVFYDRGSAIADENIQRNIADICLWKSVSSLVRTANFYVQATGVPKNSASWTSYILPMVRKLKYVAYNGLTQASYKLYKSISFYSDRELFNATTFLGGKNYNDAPSGAWITIDETDIPAGTQAIVISNRDQNGSADVLVSELDYAIAGLNEEVHNVGNPCYDSVGNAEFWLDGITSAYSDMTIVGNKLIGFSGSSDDLTSAGTIYVNIYNDGFNAARTAAYTLKHKWGHCNTVDYNKWNDCLILGNGSGSYRLAGKIIIIPDFSDIVDVSANSDTPMTLSDIDAIVIDCSSYDLGSKFNVVWGDDHDKKYNLAYLITADFDTTSGESEVKSGDLETIRKIVLCMGSDAGDYGTIISGAGSDEFNGTFDIVGTFKQKTTGYPDCDQGTCYYDGELIAAIGHDGLRYWCMRLCDGVIYRKDYKQKTYYADKAQNYGNASGVCVTDGCLFIGRSSLGIMAIRTGIAQLSNKEDKVDIVAASGATLTAEVCKYYTLSNVGTLAITLPTIASGTTKVQTVTFYISAGSSPAVTWTSTHTVIFADGFQIEANGLYEISAAWNGIGWIVGMLKLVAPSS